MTLASDLSLFEPAAAKANPFEHHHLLENPFPGYGDTRFDVCTDQDQLKKAFVNALRNLGGETKTLRIDGKSGAGKTNVLRYFEQLTDKARLSGRNTAASLSNLYLGARR